MRVLDLLYRRGMTVGQKLERLRDKEPQAKLAPHEIKLIERGDPGKRTHMRTYELERVGDQVIATVIELPVGRTPRGPDDGRPRRFSFPASESPIALEPGARLKHVLAVDLSGSD